MTMFRKWLISLFGALLMLGSGWGTGATIAQAAVHAPLPAVVTTTSGAAKGVFSGGYSTRGRSYGSYGSYASSGAYSGSYSQYSTGGTYHSGYRSPSPGVSRGTYGSYNYGTSGWSSFGSHLFSFGAGWLLGSLFHPFGGYWGMTYHPFSLLGLLVDLILLAVIVMLVRRIFFRR
jgi:hypothetical protein